MQQTNSDLKPICRDLPASRQSRWRFSLRAALIAMTVACVVAYIASFGFHVIIFLAAIVAAAGTIWALIRAKRRWKPSLAWAAAAAWLFLYVASIGPAAVLFEGQGIGDEVCEFIYGPLLMLDNALPTRPINDYADQWQRTLRR